MPVIDLSSEQRLAFLQAAADLRRLPMPLLLALAGAMELRRYPVKHIFYGLHDPVRDRPLRLVLHGRVVVQPGVGDPRTLGPGNLLGLEGFVEFIDQQDLGAPDLGLARAAHVLDPCVVLELPAAAFPALLAGPEGQALRDHLLGLQDARARSSAVVRALAATPELRGVRLDRLLELADGARLVRVEPHTVLLSAAEIPFAAYVQLAGRLTVTTNPELQDKLGPATGVRSGDVFGQRHLLARRMLPAHVVARENAELAELPAQRYAELMRAAPDLRRAIARNLAELESQEGG